MRTGIVNSIDTAAKSHKDVPVTFSSPFSAPPIVVCSIRTPSTNTSYGATSVVPINATASGFTMRVINYGDKGVMPSVGYVAVLAQ